MSGQSENMDILMDDVFAEEQEFLEHIGVSVLDGAPIGSGRYRYGSGDSARSRRSLNTCAGPASNTATARSSPIRRAAARILPFRPKTWKRSRRRSPMS